MSAVNRPQPRNVFKPTARAVAASRAATKERLLREDARFVLALGRREDPAAEALIDAYVEAHRG